MKYLDIIIIGSGMSGLYSAYKIKKESPNTTLLVLEKFKKKWIGGRTSNEMFFETQIVTGAGIGRKDTNPLLIELMKEFNIKYTDYKSIMNYSKLITPINIIKIIGINFREIVIDIKLGDITYNSIELIEIDTIILHSFSKDEDIKTDWKNLNNTHKNKVLSALKPYLYN